MQTILIANPKGGSGKTTLATNVAGWLAGKRQRVAIDDRDPQQSATGWLARRPALFPPIALVEPGARRKDAKALDLQWCVVDSPAGLHGEALRDAVRAADMMLVPLTPSAYDMAATQRFFEQLAEIKAVRQGTLPIGVVAMRVDVRTHSATELDEFLQAYDMPVVAHLRQTQVYVACARDGASVFDLPRSRAEQDWEQWRVLTRWIARHSPVRG
ncbi:MAG: ParA family protein [Burkholderiales bacterium]